MRAALLVLAACLAAPLRGADTLATWAFGSGRIGDAPAAAQAPVAAGQVVRAGNNQPARLRLTGFARSDLIIAAGGTVALTTEPGPAGATRLVIEVRAGAAQIDLSGAGRYQAVLVRGAAVEVRSTGAGLLLVERERDDLDYVAVVKGKFTVDLRREVAATIKNSEALALQPRQGLAISGKDGLGGVDTLTNRPQIALAAGAEPPLREQAGGAVRGDGEWDQDHGAAATAAVAEVRPPPPGTGPAQPPPPPPPPGPPAPPALAIAPEPPPPPVDPRRVKARELNRLRAELAFEDIDQPGGVIDDVVEHTASP